VKSAAAVAKEAIAIVAGLEFMLKVVTVLMMIVKYDLDKKTHRPKMHYNLGKSV
jgi:hypothetical protein